MKLATFFDKFELFADMPDAVAKMREFVLEMALQGKLSEQRLEDTSDPEWVTLVHRVDSGAEAATALMHVPHEIPSVWKWTTLQALGETKPRNDAPDNAQASFVPMTLIPANFGQSAQHKVRSWREIKKGYTHFTDGDVVMAKITPCFENGKSAVMGELIGGLGAGTTELHVFRRSTAAVLPEFVIIQLKSRGFITRGISRMTGSAGQKRVPYDYFAKAPFPLPPLAEQKRIVAKVYELMALCDRLEAQQQERETRHAALARASLARFAEAPTPANLHLLFHKSYSIPPADLRKSILTLAVQGKLIRFEADDGKQTVGDHIEFQNGYAFKSEWFRPSGTRLCRNANVSHGILDWRETAFVDDKTAKEFERFALNERDIVLSLDRPIIATGLKVARIAKSDLPCLLLQRVAKPVPRHNQIDLSYFFLWLNSPEFVDSIDPGRSNGVPHISTRQVQRLPFVLPPLAQQRRVVAKVVELMAMVDALETQLATARTAGVALLGAAIHELLNPTAEIIPFPSSECESLPDRAAIGCYAIQRLADQRTFGRTAEVKVLYLAEAHLGLDLGGRYLRDAAGPLDQWIYKFEEDAARLRWFSVVESQTKDGYNKIEYRGGSMLAAKAQEASARLSAAQRSEFDRLLGLLAQKPTVEVEIIATLFAAWNDFLIDGRQPSDDEIVREVRENWHPSKQRFKEPELKTWLAWMRQHALVPQGRGPHTVGQQGMLQLH